MVEQSKGTARPPPWVDFRKDSSEIAPSTAPHWQFLPAKRDAHVMPETNRQRLQVLARRPTGSGRTHPKPEPKTVLISRLLVQRAKGTA
jgi:hypothetical protein